MYQPPDTTPTNDTATPTNGTATPTDTTTPTTTKNDQTTATIIVNSDNLKDYVGNPLFISDRMYETTPPGVVMGLAWTAMGGSTLYIETVIRQPLKEEGKESKDVGGVYCTGQLGDVMKESVDIAYSFANVIMLVCLFVCLFVCLYYYVFV